MEARFKVNEDTSMLSIVLNMINDGQVASINILDSNGDKLRTFDMSDGAKGEDLGAIVAWINAGHDVKLFEEPFNSSIKLSYLSDGSWILETHMSGFTYHFNPPSDEIIYRGAFRGLLNQGFFPALTIRGSVLDDVTVVSSVANGRDLTSMREYVDSYRIPLEKFYSNTDSTYSLAGYPFPGVVYRALKKEGLVS